MTTISKLRRKVRTTYPMVKITVRTVSFTDLAGPDAQPLCLKFKSGLRDAPPQAQADINKWAREAGVVPDTSIY